VRVAAALVCATVLSYLLGWALGVPVLVPAFNAAAGYAFMIRPVRDGKLASGINRMLLWAATMALCATTLAYLRPAATAELFLNAAAYEREMLAWVDTGIGRESRPREFLPQHAAHAAVFSALSFASGSVLSMPLGAMLMNYMGHYVGALAATHGSPWLLLAGWHPWSLVRVTSFVIIGVVLAGPVVCLASGSAWRWNDAARRWVSVALAGLVLDLVLKALLAPMWRRLLISLSAG
jgi:hypothetical protein